MFPLETLPPPRGSSLPPDCFVSRASRMWVFLNEVFYREGLLASRPTPKLEDHPSNSSLPLRIRFRNKTSETQHKNGEEVQVKTQVQKPSKILGLDYKLHD